jgi:phenylacetate-coenzyme A ligase PaaK-like adenylate-forming protein
MAPRAFDAGYRALPISVQKLARRARGAVPYPWVRGLTFGALHRHFTRHDRWSTAELQRHQLAQLRRIAQLAERHVPAYRARLRQAGLAPGDIRSLADWRALPITTKVELQDAPEAFVNASIPAHARQARTTSGSTGTPLTLWLTKRTQQAELAVMFRGWEWNGYRPGDRIAVCAGALSGERLGPAHAPHTRYRDEIELSPSHLDERGALAYLELLRTFAPAHFRTYPSVAMMLAKTMADRGLEPPRVRTIWTQSETMDADDRAYIEASWGAPVVDYYGMQEKCVAMSQCEAGRMHVHSDFGLVEFVESDFPPLCHVIATGFYNDAMPLLRYATRDLAIPETTPCPCGRALPTVRRLVGRLEDYLVDRDGAPVLEADATIASLTTIRECQIVQESLERTRVLVVPGRHYQSEDGDELARRLRQQLGDGVEVTIETKARIPRTKTGKQRFIVSRVTSNWEP